MDISTLINDFLRQNIQSEAEVRSKLIVPLLELLEYPKDLRAEEFPVYGYEGSKALKTKAADFLQFTSNEFDINRGKTEKELEWVYKHSLLVFEAKKPTEKILVKGQPVFYSAWTKSIAYVISNGVDIEGYIVNANYSDICVFSCTICEIPEKWEEINLLNYNRIQKLKDEADDRGKWTNRDVYEVYRNQMRVRCMEELYASIDRSLEEITYDLNIVRNGESKDYYDILDDTCKVITSEPGGGKSHLMWMLMRDYLLKYSENDKRIPVILEGRYFGKIYSSIAEGIYKELTAMLPFITKELIEKRLREGGFVILFDALDEVEYKYDILAYDLHQLRRTTDNIIIITSRIQNYKGDFQVDFVQYLLEPLSDSKVIELLKRYSNGKMDIQIHQIPSRLLEVIRTPLFLKMFVAISAKEKRYIIPSNHTALFEMYIAEKARLLSCSFYEETMIKRILGKYAIYSFENGDSTESFFEILEEVCDSPNREKLSELIRKTGLISKGLQGIKYFHKAFHEFFVALYLSSLDKKELDRYLDRYVLQEKYNEVICYLTGIMSNRQKQNRVLDYLEINNLKLYVKALESRRNFKVTQQELDVEYAKKYYTQILETYDRIIRKHFNNICSIFDGYQRSGKGKVCIQGDINFVNGSISMEIFNGTLEAEQLRVTVSAGNGVRMISPDGKSIPINSSVFTMGRQHIRGYNLRLLSYEFDSAREIALDMIKKQIKVAMEQKILFDIDIKVLLTERIEKELKRIRNKYKKRCQIEKMSLYNNDISNVIKCVERLKIHNHEMDGFLALCKLLALEMKNADELLDVRPDLQLEKGRHSYYYDELYSDEQLVNKVEKILYLSEKATKKIVMNIVPVLSSVIRNTRIIGIVHRKDKCAGVDYIKVQLENGEEEKPIITFREESIRAYPKLNKYYLDELKKIGKSDKDIIYSRSSALMKYFDDDIFHNIIYEEIKDAFKSLLGKLS